MKFHRLGPALLLTLGLTFASPHAAARVPSQIDAQGVLRDGAGDLVDVPDATIVFRLYDAAVDGELLWSESQELPIVMGVFDALLPGDPLIELPTAVQERLALGDPMWLSVQVDGQAELPRSPLVSVPYAFTANHALTAGTAADLACSGCIDASMIDGSAFTAQHLGYAPEGDDLVTATTVGGAIAQLDGYVADQSADLLAHKGDPNAHHPADSGGIDIVPASVTVGASKLTDGELDLGPGAKDSLNAALVTTLTSGGNADALHSHTAASISGVGGGGSCFTRWGSGACPQGFTESNVGIALFPFLAATAGGVPSAGSAVCVEGATLNAYGFVGSAGWVSGGPGAQGGYQSAVTATLACATCCPSPVEGGSCRNETIYKDSPVGNYYAQYGWTTPIQSYGPLTVGYLGRSYTVAALEVGMSIGAGNSTGSVSAYDLEVLDSAGTVLVTAPLRYARMSAGEYTQIARAIYRADVSLTLPDDNKLTVRARAVASGELAAVLASEDCGFQGCTPTRSWVSVTGCVIE